MNEEYRRCRKNFLRWNTKLNDYTEKYTIAKNFGKDDELEEFRVKVEIAKINKESWRKKMVKAKNNA